jgi:hypothetical protein
VDATLFKVKVYSQRSLAENVEVYKQSYRNFVAAVVGFPVGFIVAAIIL